MSNAPEAAAPAAPPVEKTEVEVDVNQVLARARQHPVAGPYVELIIRDLMMAKLAEELQQTRQQLAAATGRPAPTSSAPRPGAKPQRAPRKRAAASAAGSKPPTT